MGEMNVLVPLDGSRTAEHSLVYLDALRQLGPARFMLFSVADEAEDFHGEASEEAIERESNLLSTYLREVGKDVQTHLGVEVLRKVVRGVPAARVLEDIEVTKPDLVVISSHGRSGVKRWRLGSVADKVIRGAECDILVVGPKAHEAEVWLDVRAEQPFKSILVPLDGSPLADQALTVAERYGACFGATLHLVRAVSMPSYATGFAGEGAYLPELLDTLVKGATEDVRKAAAGLDASQVNVTDILIGDAATQLENYVTERGIDLVIMTSHGRGGLSRTALGSVTDRLLAEAKAPVLVVRPK